MCAHRNQTLILVAALAATVCSSIFVYQLVNDRRKKQEAVKIKTLEL